MIKIQKVSILIPIKEIYYFISVKGKCIYNEALDISSDNVILSEYFWDTDGFTFFFVDDETEKTKYYVISEEEIHEYIVDHAHIDGEIKTIDNSDGFVIFNIENDPEEIC